MGLALALLMLAGLAPETAEHTALMDEIEAKVVLPEGARPLNDYGRHYAFGEPGEVQATYLVPMGVPRPSQAPAGQRRWYRSVQAMPWISDGGCRMVTIRFDLATHRLLSAKCNGLG